MTPILERVERFVQLHEQTTEQLLISGGDARLELNKDTNLNKYGCTNMPDRSLISFSSSTGSTISERGFTAATALHQRLLQQDSIFSESRLYQHELDRVRQEWNKLCEISPESNVSTIFAASGTDLHLLCSQLVANSKGKPLQVIMMDPAETGGGVAPALHGKHFNENAALGGRVNALQSIAGAHPVEVASIQLRTIEGIKRPLKEIDVDITKAIQHAVGNGQRVLLIAIDVSKTGLIAPSPAYIKSLRQLNSEMVDVLIDACQFRISGQTLNAYLKLGCMVALTGSKFLTGPTFSGILHVPANLEPRLSEHKLPTSLADYSSQAEWPKHWHAAEQLTDLPNWGLLLRLEAALAELRAFRAIPELQIKTFLEKFSSVVQHAIRCSSHFSLLAEHRIDRSPIYSKPSWDQTPTIIPFLLQHQAGQPLTREQTQQIYKELQSPIQLSATHIVNPAIGNARCLLGQPVMCGRQHGVDVSALRICASTRLIVEACENAFSSRQVIQRALNALDKTAYLIRKLK